MAEILIITRNFPPMVGGMENLLSDIYEYLSHTHRVRVIAPGDPKSEQNRDVIRIPTERLSIFLVRAFFVVLKEVTRKRADIFISGSLVVNAVTVVCGILFRTPRIAVCHGLDIIYPGWLYQVLLMLTVKRNQILVANSHNTRNLLLEKGVSEEKVWIIHPGISSKFILALDSYQSQRSLETSSKINVNPTILSVGRLTKRKGVLDFIKNCFQEILHEIPDCRLIIVGDDPKQALAHKVGEMSLVIKTVEEMDLSDNVFFAGQVSDSDLMKFYIEADVLIFPVKFVPGDVEGFGMVAIEAALVETPAVAFRIGGIPDAIEHGVTGILVEPGDYNALAMVLIDLLSDEVKRKSIGAVARRQALSRFTWDELGKKWDILISSLATRK